MGPLQCGHDFSVMESKLAKSIFEYIQKLQCGHDFSVMERAANLRPR
jgi:hypothetical protein